MIYIPPASDQHLSDQGQSATQIRQEHDGFMQQNNAEVPQFYNCGQFSFNIQHNSDTEPQFNQETVGEHKEYVRPAQYTVEPQESPYFQNGYITPVVSQQILPMSESSHHLQMNNLFNICPHENNINTVPQSVTKVHAYQQSTKSYDIPINPFADASQDFTHTGLFLFAQPAMGSNNVLGVGIVQQPIPSNDLLSIEFDPDFGILHNNIVIKSDCKPIGNSPTDNREFSLQSLDYQVLSESWRGQLTENTCQENMGVNSAKNNDNVFNSAYTDTVTSVTSRQFLIKPSEHNKNTATDEGEIKEVHFNCGYTELLNKDSKVKEVDFTISDPEKEHTSMQRSDYEYETESVKEYKLQAIVKEPTSPFQYIEEFFHQHLIPVLQNDIISLDIQEIMPSSAILFPSSPYTEITNNLTVADESFLFESQSSLCDQDMKTQDNRAVTMQNLYEKSSFLNLTNIEKMGHVCQKALIYLKDDLTFGSLASLNNMAVKNCSNPAQEVSLIDSTRNVDIVPSTRHRRNVFALSIAITLLFIAMGSVRNLQSSLNQEGGVGIISMAVSFVGYMLGSIFSSSIVQNFQPRRCIVISLIPNLVYVAANIYPAVWLMTVVSLIQGISLAIIWNAMSTYITFLSRGHALKKNEDFEKVSNNFFGIFCLIYQSYHIIGNLIASLVLMPKSSAANILLQNLTNNFTIMKSQEGTIYESSVAIPVLLEFDSVSKISNNVSLFDVNHLHRCGANFCNHFEIGGSGVTVSQNTKFMLFGIYMGCIAVAIVIAAFLLEPLNHRLFNSTISPAQKMKLQLISLAKFSIDTRFLLLLPLLMYSIMQFGFLSGEVTMAFVTCPLGIHMVGYAMICFGVTASICSYISGILCKYTGRMSQIVTAAALNLAVLVFMTQWQPNLNSLIPYFVVMAVWGVSDGIWNCQVNSLMGVVFPDKYEEAYAGLRIAQGLGVAILFSYSNLVCMTVKIYIIATVCVFSLVCYLIMEGVLKHRIMWKQTPVKQTSV